MIHTQKASSISTGRKRIFNSVFPSASLEDSPAQKLTTVNEVAEEDRAWQVATSFLAVPDKGFEVLDKKEQLDELEILEQWNRSDSLSKETADALALVVRRNLLGWYEDEVRRHFLRNFRAGLLEVCVVAWL